MAEQIVLTDLVNLQNETTAVNAINSNNSTIEEAFLDVLSLSGTAPNAMQSTLDMNSNQIINLPPPATQDSPARVADLTATPYGALGTMGLQNSNAVSITGGSISGTSLASTVTGVTETVGTNNTTLATTAFVLANQATGASPATAIPLVDSGSGAVGTSLLYARQDHVHPLSASNSVPIYQTRAALQAATPAGGFNYVIVLQSYQDVTDPNGVSTPATYIRTSGTPAVITTGYIQDASGVYWQNNESQLWASQFRLPADGKNWAPAIQQMLTFAKPYQVCNIETTDTGLYINGSGTAIFTITKPLTLQGGNLYWDSNLSTGTNIFTINQTGGVIQFLKIRDMRIIPQSGISILPTDLWVARLNHQVYGDNVFAITDGAYTQNMEISNCTFGPTFNYTIYSPVTSADYFRGLQIRDNNFWGGVYGLIGDSCMFDSNVMNGFQTAFELWNGNGASECVISHNDIFTSNGALRWHGGDRLRYIYNNAETYGPKTGTITACVEILHDIEPTCLQFITEGNYTGVLIATSGTFAGQPTGLSRVQHYAGTSYGKIDCEVMATNDSSCIYALMCDSTCATMNIRPTNDYTGLSVSNLGTGTILT